MTRFAGETKNGLFKDRPSQVAVRLLDLILCLALLAMAVFMVRLDIRDVRQLNRFSTAVVAPSMVVLPHNLRGYDEQGRSIRDIPGWGSSVLIYVIHGTRFHAEVDLWNRIRSQSLASSIEFVGVCGDIDCVRAVTDDPRKLHFISVLYADYLAMKSLLDADARKQIVLLDRATGKIRILDYPQSPESLAKLESELN
jgi:hypothetical protein